MRVVGDCKEISKFVMLVVGDFVSVNNTLSWVIHSSLVTALSEQGPCLLGIITLNMSERSWAEARFSEG